MQSTKYILHQYSSIHKFVDQCEIRADRRSGASVLGELYWTGTASLDEAIKFAKYGGWQPENVDRFRSMFDELEPRLRKLIDFQMERFPGPIGDEVNVAEYLIGNPDHMIDWVPNEDFVKRRVLCLLIGHSISGGLDADDLMVRGRAVIALVRALSLLGYELEIWSEETVRAYSTDLLYSTLVRLHGAGEVLDESAIEFAIGNPSWLRRLLFAHQEGESKEIRQRYGFSSGGRYGSITTIQHSDLVGSDLEIDLGSGRWFESDDPDAGMKWIVEHLKALGAVSEGVEIDWTEG